MFARLLRSKGGRVYVGRFVNLNRDPLGKVIETSWIETGTR